MVNQRFWLISKTKIAKKLKSKGTIATLKELLIYSFHILVDERTSLREKSIIRATIPKDAYWERLGLVIIEIVLEEPTSEETVFDERILSETLPINIKTPWTCKWRSYDIIIIDTITTVFWYSEWSKA